MKRHILFILFTICAIVSNAQSMSDDKVMNTIMAEHAKGTSQQQIVIKLMQSGVNINQIRRVRKMYESMKSGSSASSGRVTTNDRSRTNNGQMRPGASKKQIAEGTLSDYQDDMEEANQYSNYRVSAPHTHSNTYDETDPEYLQMQQEMDDWMPQDTAAMYKQLIKKLSRDKKKVYGRDIFNNKDLSFEPNMNIAMPRNYRLGPGDAVFIDIYGASQKSIETTVAPDGIITIEGFGPVQVSGLTVQQANNRIKQKMGSRYSSSSIRLSVGQTHTITVNIMGEVKKPGTYTLSAFASVFHALYMAGGISDLGTLRNIKVFRNNRLISVVDIYDYLLNGRQSGNIKLTDNDFIVVGAYDCLVNITGKVKRPMFYEMKRNETLSSLLRYAGGFTGDAYKKTVRVRRKTGREYSIYNVNEFDMSNFHVTDEDSVSVDSIIPRYENMVKIKGAVFRPGMYQVGGDINSVRTLIEAAEGLTEYAFSPHAVLHRMKPNRTLEVISVDIDGILNGKIADIPLQNEDEIFIPTRQDAQIEQTITIHGEVQYPGTYRFADNETLEDFILQAGGLKETASTVKVDISRRITNPTALTTDSLTARTYSFALKDGFVVDGQNGFLLEPFDQVYVRKSPGSTTPENITIDGEVLFAGTYSLPKQNTRLTDIIKAAGGLSNLAYAPGARLERRTNESERRRMEQAFKMANEQQQKNLMNMAIKSSNASAITDIMQQQKQTALSDFQVPDYYPIGIELDKALKNPGGQEDLVLREGDRIIIPEYNGTVKINGAVMYTNTVGYIAGKNVAYYIDQAGGFANDAKKSRTYILYANGTVAKVGHNAKVRPGCEIIVPTKTQSKMSLAEMMTVGSSAASIAAVIATIANIIK